VDLPGAAAEVRGGERVHGHVDPLRLETGPEADAGLQRAIHDPGPDRRRHVLDREAEEDQREVSPVQAVPLRACIARVNEMELVPEDAEREEANREPARGKPGLAEARWRNRRGRLRDRGGRCCGCRVHARQAGEAPAVPNGKNAPASRVGPRADRRQSLRRGGEGGGFPPSPPPPPRRAPRAPPPGYSGPPAACRLFFPPPPAKTR